jgi:tetratricopeptide (TPR) repeat protein
VLASLAREVAKRTGLEPPDPGAFDNQGDFFCDTFLPQLYEALDKHCRPVFLLDEFDVLDQATEAELPETMASRALVPFLRKVMTGDPRPAFVFVVGRRAEDLSLNSSATFRTALVREIWVLDAPSAEALVRQAEVNGTLRFTDEAVNRILSLTSCHPYLTQLLCQRIWERAYASNPTTPPMIDVSGVEPAVQDALEAGDQALVWLWDGLSPAEKIYAAALAEAAGAGKTISEGQVSQVLAAHAARLRRREVELAPYDLVQRRVLEQAGDREYCFAVELFCRWVQENKPVREVKDELDRIEPFADRLYQTGKDYFNRNEWENARRLFQDALEKNPRHFRARLHLGEVLLEMGPIDEAVAELERAYEMDQEEARLPLAHAWVTKARVQEEAEDDDGALAACEQALRVFPDEQTAQEIWTAIWTRRGDEALAQDDLETALMAYRQAGDDKKIAQVEGLQQQALAAMEAEAQAHEQVERWADAIEVLGKIAQVDPTYRDAYARLDQARVKYRLQNLYKQALDHFREEKWAQAIGALEMIRQEDSDYLDVADKLEEARKRQQFATLKSERLAALYSAGIELLQRQAWEEAVATFRKLIRIAPGYRDAWQRLDEAKDKANKFGDLEDLYCAGVVNIEQKQWEAAIDYLQRIVDSGEKYKDVATLLEEAKKQLRLQTLYAEAVAQLEEEKWAQAIVVLEEIVRIDRAYEDSQIRLDNARARQRLQDLYNQVQGHFRRENWDQAIQVLNTVLRDDPEYPGAAEKLDEAREQQELAALYRAGVGFLETDRWAEAIDRFRAIIQRGEVYRDVVERMALAQRKQRLDRLFGQGTDHLLQGELEEAIRAFEDVRAMDPDYQGVQARLEEAQRQLRVEKLRQRGKASLRGENWEGAVVIFKELRELDPMNSSVSAELEEAERQLELDGLYREGMQHFRKKRWRKAEAALEQVILVDPQYLNGDAAAKLEIARESLARSNPVVEILRDPLWQGVGVIIAIIIAMSPLLAQVVGKPVEPTPMPTPKPSGFCNGAFDDNFVCWQHGGELDQTVECDDGQCYAVLGNPDYVCHGGVPVGEAWMKQKLDVPQTISPTLSLRYRIVSYDLDLYDYFRVAIDGEPLLQPYGNYEWNEPSCKETPWDSDWQNLTYDLSAYRGKEIEISFHSVNGTHPYYNTWTYIDDVCIDEVR